MTIIATPATTGCPAWCNDHTGFDDGSETWHKSADVQIGEYQFCISNGTLDRAVEVFIEGHYEGMPLDDAERFARALLAAIESAR